MCVVFFPFLAGGRYLTRIPQQGKYRSEVCPEPLCLPPHTRKTVISPAAECWNQLGSELHGGHSQTFRGLQKPELGLIPALSRQGRRRDSWVPPTDTDAQVSALVSGSESHALCQELQFLNLSILSILIYKMEIILISTCSGIKTCRIQRGRAGECQICQQCKEMQ